jgi:hypothetical protein
MIDELKDKTLKKSFQIALLENIHERIGKIKHEDSMHYIQNDDIIPKQVKRSVIPGL